jgi:hypothetical protein
LHESLADGPNLLIHGGAVHLDLLLVWCHFKNSLHVFSHIYSFEHFVALVQNKVLKVASVQVFTLNKSKYSAWSADHDRWFTIFQLFNVILNGLASVHDRHRDL